jgi:hypothetical protein
VHLQNQEEADYQAQVQTAKESCYFALFALLDFIINVPLSESSASEEVQLSEMSFRQLMSVLVKSGLL